MTAADLRPEVLAFALAMERKLRANDHKSHWRNCTLGYLRRRLRTEVRELMAALDAHRRTSLVADAADIANFCMMFADKVGGLWTAERAVAETDPESLPLDPLRAESAVDAALERAAGLDERLRYPDKERGLIPRRRRKKKSNGQAPAVPIAHVAPTVEPSALSRSVERLPFRHGAACDARHAQDSPCNDGLRTAASTTGTGARRYVCDRCGRDWHHYALRCSCGGEGQRQAE